MINFFFSLIWHNKKSLQRSYLSLFQCFAMKKTAPPSDYRRANVKMVVILLIITVLKDTHQLLICLIAVISVRLKLHEQYSKKMFCQLSSNSNSFWYTSLLIINCFWLFCPFSLKYINGLLFTRVKRKAQLCHSEWKILAITLFVMCCSDHILWCIDYTSF